MTSDNILNLIITLFNLSISFFTLFRVTNKEKQLLRYNYEFEKSKLKLSMFQDVTKELKSIKHPTLDYGYINQWPPHFTDKEINDCSESYFKIQMLVKKNIFFFTKEAQKDLNNIIDSTNLEISDRDSFLEKALADFNEHIYYPDLKKETIFENTELKHESFYKLNDILQKELYNFINTELFQ